MFTTLVICFDSEMSRSDREIKIHSHSWYGWRTIVLLALHITRVHEKTKKIKWIFWLIYNENDTNDQQSEKSISIYKRITHKESKINSWIYQVKKEEKDI